MANYWIKLYIEILNDSKMAVLPDRLWRRVIELFLAAGHYGGNGQLPETQQLAWLFRMSTDDLELDLKQIASTGIIQRNADGWMVSKFETRQAPATSTERSRYFRKKQQDNQYDGKKTCGIYKIECIANGLVYIGSSIDIDTRIKAHFRDGKTFDSHWMHDDFIAHGQDGFTVEIMELVNSDADLPAKETEWIERYKGRLYNTENKGKPHRDRYATNVQRNVAQINRLTESETESETDIDTAAAIASFNAIDDRKAERLYMQITGLTFIQRKDLADVTNAMLSVMDFYNGKEDKLIEEGKAMYAKWCSTTGQSGKTYSKLNPGWLSWWIEAINKAPGEVRQKDLASMTSEEFAAYVERMNE